MSGVLPALLRRSSVESSNSANAFANHTLRKAMREECDSNSSATVQGSRARYATLIETRFNKASSYPCQMTLTNDFLKKTRGRRRSASLLIPFFLFEKNAYTDATVRELIHKAGAIALLLRLFFFLCVVRRFLQILRFGELSFSTVPGECPA